MVSQNTGKINLLMKTWTRGTVATQPWLDSQGVYRQLSDAYVRSGWLTRIGRGAFIRAGENVDWTGALFALQKQLHLPVHVAAKTALELKGYGHYVPLGPDRMLSLFGAPGTRLPAWFLNYPWPVDVQYTTTHLFSNDEKLGLSEFEANSFSIECSTPERAIMELIHLLPKNAHFEDAQLAMESLTTLRPKLVQSLLANCKSVRVKRFFMWLAEYNQHKWVERLDVEKIDFGKGKRTLFKGGHFNKKYQITVPE